MTGLAATKSEKVSVSGVSVEVRRIAAPTAALLGSSTIVFLHEGLGSVAMWRDFPELLCQATGRPGLVFSRRGYGQSDPIPDVRGAGRLTPDYMHSEACDVLPELLRAEGITRPILLGHSDGGTIALLHAAKFDVKACIVMAPHLFVEDISVKAISATREAFEHGTLRDRLTKFHTHVDCAFWQWNDIWLSEGFRSFNIQAECRQITCPILAIQGHDDPYGTMAQINALCITSDDTQPDLSSQIDALLTQNMRRVLLKLEQCGHSPHKDQTQKVLSSISEWLALIRATP